MIGLATGSMLHLSSAALVSIFNLTPAPKEQGRTAASVRAAREEKLVERAWQSSTSREQERWRANPPSIEDLQWLEKDPGSRRGEPGLLGQTILEEEDDSED